MMDEKTDPTWLSKVAAGVYGAGNVGSTGGQDRSGPPPRQRTSTLDCTLFFSSTPYIFRYVRS